MDKVLNAAAEDPYVYVTEAQISPMGSVIGKVLLGVSTAQVDDTLSALDRRFTGLIESSGQLVQDGLNGAAKDSSAILAARLRVAHEAALGMAGSSRQLVESAAERLLWRVSVGLVIVAVLVLLLLLVLVLVPCCHEHSDDVDVTSRKGHRPGSRRRRTRRRVGHRAAGTEYA